MGDYELILSEIIKLLSKNFTVFGFNLNCVAVYVGVFLLGVAFWSIRKLLK